MREVLLYRWVDEIWKCLDDDMKVFNNERSVRKDPHMEIEEMLCGITERTIQNAVTCERGQALKLREKLM